MDRDALGFFETSLHRIADRVVLCEKPSAKVKKKVTKYPEAALTPLGGRRTALVHKLRASAARARSRQTRPPRVPKGA